MKKISFAIVLTLFFISCSRESVGTGPVVATSNAVSFSAYTTSPVSKGVMIENDDILTEDGAGIGVFAFLQAAVSGNKIDFNSRKFATPDFMYNQQIHQDGSDNWVYKPIKYWPNEAGDQLSFFAYAPYDAAKKWEDLGFSTDATGSTVKASVHVNNEKEMMEDILWADPQLNQSNKLADGSNNLNKSIAFSFRHLLSKITIQLGVDDSWTLESNAEPWEDEDTDITVDKIEFLSMASDYDFSKTTGSTPVTTWLARGSQDVVLKSSDFQNNVISYDTWSTAEGGWGDPDEETYYRDILAQEDSKDACLFFVPQAYEAGTQKVAITYTIKTTDADHPSNSFKKSVTITKDLADIFPQISGTTDNGVETGKAYLLKFLIGMNEVIMDASETDWDTVSESEIHTPADVRIKIQFVSKSAKMLSYNYSGTGAGLPGETLNIIYETEDVSDPIQVYKVVGGAPVLLEEGVDYTLTPVTKASSGCFKLEYVLPEDEGQIPSEMMIITGNVKPVLASAGRTGNVCSYTQLWEGGPKFADFYLGSTIDDYSQATGSWTYSDDDDCWGTGPWTEANCGKSFKWGATVPGDAGEHYSGDAEELPAERDMATQYWGADWQIMSAQIFSELKKGLPEQTEMGITIPIIHTDTPTESDRCVWEFIDGTTKQYVDGCTLSGWKISGKGDYAQNSIFLLSNGMECYMDFMDPEKEHTFIHAFTGRADFYFTTRSNPLITYEEESWRMLDFYMVTVDGTMAGIMSYNDYMPTMISMMISYGWLSKDEIPEMIQETNMYKEVQMYHLPIVKE